MHPLLIAILLGILQGLTEFLPVSSSGHLEIGKALLGLESADDATLSVILHAGTMLSTVVVFWRDIVALFRQLFTFRWNEHTQYIAWMALSCIPAGLIGLLFKKQLDQLFDRDMVLVGGSLLFTALLLWLSHILPGGEKPVTWRGALAMGVAQAVAILPGVSRSGSTISTGLITGMKRTEVTRFSFLMVLPLIFGANLLELKEALEAPSGAVSQGPGWAFYLVGFLVSFAVGVVACRLMIRIVNRGGLVWFAAYCLLAGCVALGWGLLQA